MRAGRLRTTAEGHLLVVLGAGSDRGWTVLAAWARRGLELGEKVLYAAHRADEGHVLDHLQASGVDARLAAAEERLEVVPAAAFAEAGAPELAVRNALDEGFPGVRLAPPVQVGRRHSPLETTLAGLCRTQPVSAMCRYERGGIWGTRLGAVVDAHPDGVRSPMLLTRRIGSTLAVAGEVDISNVDLVGAALDAVVRAAGGVVRLDLADLRFMDVAACRALARRTEAFRTGGGRLIVADPLPPVAHVLTLLGVGSLHGIQLVRG